MINLQKTGGVAALIEALAYTIGFVMMAGLLTVVPLLGNLGIVFGLGQIVWFTWLGFIMLHRPIR